MCWVHSAAPSCSPLASAGAAAASPPSPSTHCGKAPSLGAESIWLPRQQDLLSDIGKHHLADRYFQESTTALANTLSTLQRYLSVVESHRRGNLWHSCSPRSLAELIRERAEPTLLASFNSSVKEVFYHLKDLSFLLPESICPAT